MKNYLLMFASGGRSFVATARTTYDPRFDIDYTINTSDFAVGDYVRPNIPTKPTTTTDIEDEYYAGYNGNLGQTDYSSSSTSRSSFVSGNGGGKDNNGEYTNALYIIQKLKEEGMPDNAATALAIHAGAESGYKLNAKNSRSSAFGLGQWVGGSQDRLLQLWNKKYHDNRTSMKDFNVDDLIKALKLWYWDNGIGKHGANPNDSVYNLVSEFAQYGFAPAYYGNVDRIVLYARETGHDVDDWDKHIRTRITNAGFLLS